MLLRHDWTRKEIRDVYWLSIPELIFQAQVAHRKYHHPEEVQLCRLLSIKTGGCPEDCGYCPQSAHYATGVQREELVSREVALQAARQAGAGRTFVLDVDDTRLELARSLGATQTFNSRNADVIARIVEQTAGRGADAALECVGTTVPVKLALDSVRKGGAVTLVGNLAPTIELGLQSAVTRQIRLQGSCASSGEYPACISLISRGAIQVEPLLSAVAPLADGAAWFHRLYEREPGLMKIVLQP